MRTVLFILGAAILVQPALGDAPVVRLVEFEATINPITVNRILRAIDDAEEAGDELILVELDTPGGLLDSTQDVVKRMLASEVPIVVWVGPSGAHAASAGFFLLIASDVAAMAPGTRTGAASTVFGTGEGSEDNVLLKKANEDSAALLRSVAQKRGRNPEASEETVFSSKAYEETVALEKGLIDLIADDREDLLAQLDGREIERFDGTKQVLRTAGATFVTSEFHFRQRFMEALAHPWLAYLLLTFGMLGLYVEFTNPGLVFPGVVGALCLLLFALTLQALPVSSIGLLLILLGIVMFVLEVKVVSYGMLTFGGILCLLIGSTMLIDGPIPELRVPPSLVLPVTLVLAGLCAFAVRLAVRAQRAKIVTGAQGLVDGVGTVTEDLAPEGKVAIHGELWNAAARVGTITKGTRVRVLAVDELNLTVEPAGREPEGR